jgi:hypothetical protein
MKSMRLRRRGKLYKAMVDNGWTPIHRAVCCFHINMVQYLVSLGANINGLQKFRSLGRGLLLRYSHFLFLFAPQAQVIIELVPAVLATHK